jgi:hypothetical protein
MAKHAVRERLTPTGLSEWLKTVGGIGSERITHGEKLIIDLESTPALSPYVPSGVGVWQRLRTILVLPDLDKPPYALVEAINSDREQVLFLTRLVEEGDQTHVAKVLGDKRANANGSTWQSTIQVSPDGRFVAVEHGGAGDTEVIGAQTLAFQGEDPALPVEAWAPDPREVARLLPPYARAG